MESGQSSPIREDRHAVVFSSSNTLKGSQNFIKVHKYTSICTDGVKHADDEPAKFHTCAFKDGGVNENLTYFSKVYRIDSRSLSN